MTKELCPVARQLYDFRNDLIVKQGLPAAAVARGFACVGGHACGWEAAVGKSDEVQEAFDEGHARGRADYCDSISARIDELESENAALRIQVNRLIDGTWVEGDAIRPEDLDRLKEHSDD